MFKNLIRGKNGTGGTTKTTHLSGFFVLYWFLNEIIKATAAKLILDSEIPEMAID